MATQRIDGDRVKQPDGTFKLEPGKRDGKLIPACGQGCSEALNREGMRDAVENLCGDKACE
jgi:hypothetical protein